MHFTLSMNKIVRKKEDILKEDIQEDIRRDTNRRRNEDNSRFNVLNWQLSDCDHLAAKPMHVHIRT